MNEIFVVVVRRLLSWSFVVGVVEKAMQAREDGRR